MINTKTKNVIDIAKSKELFIYYFISELFLLSVAQKYYLYKLLSIQYNIIQYLLCVNNKYINNNFFIVNLI